MSSEIKVGDLVETCSLLPGVVMKIYEERNDIKIEVRMLHVDDYTSDNYASCSIKHCGIRKINAGFAKMLAVVGMPRISEIYKSIQQPTKDKFYCEYDKLIAEEYNVMISNK